MKKQFLKSALAIFLLLLLFFAGCTWFLEKTLFLPETENGRVLLNEIRQLTTDETGRNPAGQELALLEKLMDRRSADSLQKELVLISGIYMVVSVFCILILFLFLYFKIIRPFHRLESYAGEIAKGNLEVSLSYERTNVFGAFTWAFDHMREEIIRARNHEKKAIRENKTIIATLSHDIKTPIASIRAYAEGLEANLDSDYIQRERYLAVILKKCDEVTSLTNDLVLHSLSELEHLEINLRNMKIKAVLEEILSELNCQVRIRVIEDCLLTVDKKRLAQVMENLLGNAEKYAPGAETEVWAQIMGKQYEIHVRDHGGGVPPEDMPFLFDKFYRGGNAEEVQGSGLGLYIVSYIIKRMDGEILPLNHEDGLEMVVILPV